VGIQAAAFGAFYRERQDGERCHKTMSAFFAGKEGFVAGCGRTDIANGSLHKHSSSFYEWACPAT
jgi:hypothetical protein